jgi:hypothetical protein
VSVRIPVCYLQGGAGDTPIREVSLNGLLTAPGRPLLVHHFTYGKLQTGPLPEMHAVDLDLPGQSRTYRPLAGEMSPVFAMLVPLRRSCRWTGGSPLLATSLLKVRVSMSGVI